MSEDEAKLYIKVPTGCGHILKIRRINRKISKDGLIEWKPTETCVITFDGQVLPKRLFCCYTSLPVEQYIYPTIQCRKCCRFGHVESVCRSKPRCFKCGHDHPGNGCDIPETTAFGCVLCSGSHFANSKNCPEYGRQRAIKCTMAEKTVSYLEASKSIPPASRNYANAVKGISTPQSHSYRKTVFLNPKTHAPLSPSFDRIAHQNLISTPTSAQPNGCAFNSPNLNSSDSMTPILNLLIQLITYIPSITQSPSNVAKDLISVLSNYKDGFTTNIPSVEREERVS